MLLACRRHLGVAGGGGLRRGVVASPNSEPTISKARREPSEMAAGMVKGGDKAADATSNRGSTPPSPAPSIVSLLATASRRTAAAAAAFAQTSTSRQPRFSRRSGRIRLASIVGGDHTSKELQVGQRASSADETSKERNEAIAQPTPHVGDDASEQNESQRLLLLPLARKLHRNILSKRIPWHLVRSFRPGDDEGGGTKSGDPSGARAFLNSTIGVLPALTRSHRIDQILLAATTAATMRRCDNDVVNSAVSTTSPTHARDEHRTTAVSPVEDERAALPRDDVIRLQISGATGCGKSVIVPLKLVEHHWRYLQLRLEATFPELITTTNSCSIDASPPNIIIGAPSSSSAPSDEAEQDDLFHPHQHSRQRVHRFDTSTKERFVKAFAQQSRIRVIVSQPTRIACVQLATFLQRILDAFGAAAAEELPRCGEGESRETWQDSEPPDSKDTNSKRRSNVSPFRRIGYAVSNDVCVTPGAEIVFATPQYILNCMTVAGNKSHHHHHAASLRTSSPPHVAFSSSLDDPTDIILDEVHRRDLFTDMVLLWCRNHILSSPSSPIATSPFRRESLRSVVVMSATSNTSLLARYLHIPESHCVLLSPPSPPPSLGRAAAGEGLLDDDHQRISSDTVDAAQHRQQEQEVISIHPLHVVFSDTLLDAARKEWVCLFPPTSRYRGGIAAENNNGGGSEEGGDLVAAMNDAPAKTRPFSRAATSKPEIEVPWLHIVEKHMDKDVFRIALASLSVLSKWCAPTTTSSGGGSTAQQQLGYRPPDMMKLSSRVAMLAVLLAALPPRRKQGDQRSSIVGLEQADADDLNEEDRVLVFVPGLVEMISLSKALQRTSAAIRGGLRLNGGSGNVDTRALGIDMVGAYNHSSSSRNDEPDESLAASTSSSSSCTPSSSSISIGLCDVQITLLHSSALGEASRQLESLPSGVNRNRRAPAIGLIGQGRLQSSATTQRSTGRERGALDATSGPRQGGALTDSASRAFRQCRLIIATNVAESSLTIPGLRAVIDYGQERVVSSDALTGGVSISTQYASTSSMMQRRGRVGRTSPGVAIHLFPQAIARRLAPHEPAEAVRGSASRLVLLSKLYFGAARGAPPLCTWADVVARLPTPPSVRACLHAAEELAMHRLTYIPLSAATIANPKPSSFSSDEMKKDHTPPSLLPPTISIPPELRDAYGHLSTGLLTRRGHFFAVFPLELRWATLVYYGGVFGSLHDSVLLACILSVPSVFLPIAAALRTAHDSASRRGMAVVTEDTIVKKKLTKIHGMSDYRAKTSKLQQQEEDGEEEEGGGGDDALLTSAAEARDALIAHIAFLTQQHRMLRHLASDVEGVPDFFDSVDGDDRVKSSPECVAEDRRRRQQRGGEAPDVDAASQDGGGGNHAASEPLMLLRVMRHRYTLRTKRELYAFEQGLGLSSPALGTVDHAVALCAQRLMELAATSSSTTTRLPKVGDEPPLEGQRSHEDYNGTPHEWAHICRSKESVRVLNQLRAAALDRLASSPPSATLVTYAPPSESSPGDLQVVRGRLLSAFVAAFPLNILRAEEVPLPKWVARRFQWNSDILQAHNGPQDGGDASSSSTTAVSDKEGEDAKMLPTVLTAPHLVEDGQSSSTHASARNVCLLPLRSRTRHWMEQMGPVGSRSRSGLGDSPPPSSDPAAICDSVLRCLEEQTLATKKWPLDARPSRLELLQNGLQVAVSFPCSGEGATTAPMAVRSTTAAQRGEEKRGSSERELSTSSSSSSIALAPLGMSVLFTALHQRLFHSTSAVPLRLVDKYCSEGRGAPHLTIPLSRSVETSPPASNTPMTMANDTPPPERTPASTVPASWLRSTVVGATTTSTGRRVGHHGGASHEGIELERDPDSGRVLFVKFRHSENVHHAPKTKHNATLSSQMMPPPRHHGAAIVRDNGLDVEALLRLGWDSMLPTEWLMSEKTTRECDPPPRRISAVESVEGDVLTAADGASPPDDSDDTPAGEDASRPPAVVEIGVAESPFSLRTPGEVRWVAVLPSAAVALASPQRRRRPQNEINDDDLAAPKGPPAPKHCPVCHINYRRGEENDAAAAWWWEAHKESHSHLTALAQLVRDGSKYRLRFSSFLDIFGGGGDRTNDGGKRVMKGCDAPASPVTSSRTAPSSYYSLFPVAPSSTSVLGLLQIRSAIGGGSLTTTTGNSSGRRTLLHGTSAYLGVAASLVRHVGPSPLQQQDTLDAPPTESAAHQSFDASKDEATRGGALTMQNLWVMSMKTDGFAILRGLVVAASSRNAVSILTDPHHQHVFAVSIGMCGVFGLEDPLRAKELEKLVALYQAGSEHGAVRLLRRGQQQSSAGGSDGDSAAVTPSTAHTPSATPAAAGMCVALHWCTLTTTCPKCTFIAPSSGDAVESQWMNSHDLPSRRADIRVGAMILLCLHQLVALRVRRISLQEFTAELLALLGAFGDGDDGGRGSDHQNIDSDGPAVKDPRRDGPLGGLSGGEALAFFLLKRNETLQDILTSLGCVFHCVGREGATGGGSKRDVGLVRFYVPPVVASLLPSPQLPKLLRLLTEPTRAGPGRGRPACEEGPKF